MLKLLVDINTKFGSKLYVWQLRVQGPVLPHMDQLPITCTTRGELHKALNSTIC